MKSKILIVILAVLVGAANFMNAQSPYASSADFTKFAMKLREHALLTIEPKVFVPTTSRYSVSGRYPWKTRIVTTVFWAGESATRNNPVHNRSSSWDPNWARNYGGYDDPSPSARRGYIPVAFIPRLNPFYVALPYNDVTRGTTKPEARRVIPWFRESFVREGQSVCKDRWIAIRHGRRIAYAQWSDCGPFRTDHWQYVFGKDRPKPNLNKGAGLDVSPAVRDYLGMSGIDVCDWKFVDFKDVPPGPWSHYGENNTFVLRARQQNTAVAKKEEAAAPKVVTR